MAGNDREHLTAQLADVCATVWVLWLGRRERRRVALVAAVLATVVGVLVWGASPAGHRLLSWRLDDIGLPPGARLVTEDASGNVLCFDDCPSVSRTYRVDGDHREVAGRMEASLARSGLGVAREGRDGISFSNAADADIDLTVDIRPSSLHPATAARPRAAGIPGTTVIEVRATARQGRF